MGHIKVNFTEKHSIIFLCVIVVLLFIDDM